VDAENVWNGFRLGADRPACAGALLSGSVVRLEFLLDCVPKELVIENPGWSICTGCPEVPDFCEAA